MSIEQINIVDAIGVDNLSGELVLTISDHLTWDGNDDRHLALLQEKLNAYLAFIEGGEIYGVYPDARGRALVIDVVGKYPVSEEGRLFLEKASELVKHAGATLRYGQLRKFNA